MPGVVAVYTGADLVAAGVKPMPTAPAFPRPDGKPMACAPQAHRWRTSVVRYVGEPVVAIVAETRAQARARRRRGLRRLRGPAGQRRPGARAAARRAGGVGRCARQHRAEMRHGDAAAAAAAFAQAAHVVSLDLVNQRLAPAPMEPRSVLAWIDDGRLVVRLSSQMPTGVRDSLADAVPGLTREQMRVRSATSAAASA
jgi:carbon-monoxide dehydrogenase large subunit